MNALLRRRTIALALLATLALSITGCSAEPTTETKASEAVEEAEKAKEEVEKAKEEAEQTKRKLEEDREKNEESQPESGKEESPHGSRGSSGSQESSSDSVGSYSHSGDSQFCSEHECIGDFTGEGGYVVECSDGTFSHAGGISGACSHHGGEK